MDLLPRGGFETQMREGQGAFQPKLEGCLLRYRADAALRLYHPAARGLAAGRTMAGHHPNITMDDETGATRYSIKARHKSAADSVKRNQMGIQDCWGRVIEQLSRLVTRLEP